MELNCPSDQAAERERPRSGLRKREREREKGAIPYTIALAKEKREREERERERERENRTLFTPCRKPHNKWGAHVAGGLRTPPMLGRRRERERETDPQQALAAKLLQVSVQGYKCSMTTYHGKGWAKGQQCSRAAGANSGKRSNKLGLTGVFRVPREGEDLTSSGLEACSTKRGFYLSCPAEGGPRQQSPRPAHYPDVYHRQVNKLQQRNRSVTKQAKIPSKIIVGSEIKRFRFLSGQESQTDDRLEICFGSL